MRVGIVGLGFVGSRVYERLAADEVAGAEVAFVCERDSGRLAELPSELVLESLDGIAEREVDLVVECASPSVTLEYGRDLLAKADYMPLSVSALADDRLREELLATAHDAGTRLLIPHGALAGMEALCERGEDWREVTIIFRKPPDHIEGPTGPPGCAVVYDGPVRGIATLYPRNVNAMVACALCTVGLDRCRAVLVADPALDCMEAEITAHGQDGSTLRVIKRQPGMGVSGTEIPDSVVRSIALARGAGAGLQFL